MSSPTSTLAAATLGGAIAGAVVSALFQKRFAVQVARRLRHERRQDKALLRLCNRIEPIVDAMSRLPTTPPGGSHDLYTMWLDAVFSPVESLRPEWTGYLAYRVSDPTITASMQELVDRLPRLEALVIAHEDDGADIRDVAGQISTILGVAYFEARRILNVGIEPGRIMKALSVARNAVARAWLPVRVRMAIRKARKRN